MQLACIADDYTGATDLASALTESGLRVILLFGLPEPSAPLEPDVDADAIVVALKTRNRAAHEAIEDAVTTLRWLRHGHPDKIMFKYCSTFDSTAAGNIGPVHDALLSELGQAQSISTPATPENGRTVYLGHLFVGAQLLSESSMRSHPLTPMTDSSLPRVLAAQSESEITTLPLPVVRDGVARVRTYLQYLRDHAGGPQIVLCDALDDDDLLTIADATRGMTLIAGAAGLGRAIARTTAHATLAPPLSEDVLAAAHGPAAVIAGSCSAATLSQVETMAAKYPTYRLRALELADTPDAPDRVLAWARTHLPRSPVLIAASQPPDEVAHAQQELGAARAAELVETALSTIACGLRDSGVSKIIVAGGETSGAVVNRLGVRRVRIGPLLAPGVPWIYTEDSPALLLALKSGNFGEPNFFLDALAAPLGVSVAPSSPRTSQSLRADEHRG